MRKANDNRLGNYMATSTGRKFWPLDPRPEEVEIEVIAHHLAARCRWNGATRKFYSVAEHSAYVSKFVPADDALEALLHDAAEAYSPFGDVTRPFKLAFTVVSAVEHKLEIAIARRFNIRHPWPESVKEADEAVGQAEAEQIIDMPPREVDVAYRVEAAPIRIMCLAAARRGARFSLSFSRTHCEESCGMMTAKKALLAAMEKGRQARRSGLSEYSNPYPDLRTERGSITFSRAFRRFWVEGWREENAAIETRRVS